MNRNLLPFHILSLLFILLFQPLYLSAASGNDGLGLKTVVIDPGHGGKDPGAPGKTRATSEKHIVLAISKLFGDKIKAAYPDVEVVYTRSTDVFVELKERARIATKNNADLFISIHCNSNDNSKAFGASAHILGPKSNNPKNSSDYFAKSRSVAQRENSVMMLEDDYKTAYQDFDPDMPESVIGNSLLWSANYANSLMFAAEYDACIHKAPYRVSNYTGIHQDVFYLLWATNMPSALLELGFMSNPADYAVLSSADGQEKIAQSLFDAFCRYKTKFDASLNVQSAPIIQESDSDKEKEISKPSEVTSTYYGTQIMALGRLLKENDPNFKGHEAKAVKVGNIYKYIIGISTSPAEARIKSKEIQKAFPGSFVVKVDGNNVERLK